MSKIGRQPIILPDTVTTTIEGNNITVKGPKGELNLKLHPLVVLTKAEGQLTVAPKGDTKLAHSLHGTFQRLIVGMIKGVTQGFQKSLELVGTGYRVTGQGNKIILSLGFSHPIEYTAPESITLEIEGNNKITVKGINKQLVGLVAAQIRDYRKPEPYKGKGIRYQGEHVRRKAGKAAKAAAA